MTVFVHSIVIISFKFLFVDHLGPTATLNHEYWTEPLLRTKSDDNQDCVESKNSYTLLIDFIKFRLHLINSVFIF